LGKYLARSGRQSGHPARKGIVMNSIAAIAEILAVDDTPHNLDILSSILSARGYRVRAAISAEMALMSLNSALPDLILLDVRMPGLNGYDLCRRLKSDERTRDVPVIFVSALDDPLDKVEAFAAGGLDYVTKPFHAEEVLARVETHLRLRRLRLDIEEKNRRLEDNYRRLLELETLRDNLTHMMVHDLRSPLMGVMGRLGTLLLKTGNGLEAGDRTWVEGALASARRMNEMIGAMIDVSRMETGQMPLNFADGDVSTIARQAIETLAGLADDHAIRAEYPDAPAVVRCDAEIVRRVVVNLLSNALRYTRAGTDIAVRVSAASDAVRVWVIDNGPGIPPEYHERIFEKFGQAATYDTGVKYSSGLGLTFCKMAIEAHGGRIGLVSEEGRGSAFWFDLPRTPATPNEGQAAV